MGGVQRERGGGEDRWGQPNGDMSRIQVIILRKDMICALRKNQIVLAEKLGRLLREVERPGQLSGSIFRWAMLKFLPRSHHP